MTNPKFPTVVYGLPISALNAALEGASYPALDDPRLMRKLAVQLGLPTVPAIWTTAGDMLRAGRRLTLALLVDEENGDPTPLLVCPLQDDATIERSRALLAPKTPGDVVVAEAAAKLAALPPTRRERRAKKVGALAATMRKGKRK